MHISRRAFVGGGLIAPLASKLGHAQGFAGLGSGSDGFAEVVAGHRLDFPRDHGPHPDYRIEWWYLTANLKDAAGEEWGAQWTLFRQAMAPGAQQEGWANQQIWMGHAAVTNATAHRYAEKFARGGVGQAGAEAVPFRAWIDSWEMRGVDAFSAQSVAPLVVSASGDDFGYALNLTADRSLVLQGDGGYSQKSERGQASYYYSQPYFTASGAITLGEKANRRHRPRMDGSRMEQPAVGIRPDRLGLVFLHLESGEKVMLFRLRQKDGRNYFAGNWIDGNGRSEPLPVNAIAMTPTVFTDIDGRKVPTSWNITVADRGLKIDSVPVNARSWMGTRFAYWEGPISFMGSHNGIGYLEMTGY